MKSRSFISYRPIRFISAPALLLAVGLPIQAFSATEVESPVMDGENRVLADQSNVGTTQTYGNVPAARTGQTQRVELLGSGNLSPGDKSLWVPQNAVRSTDAKGNALIRLPDGRQIRFLQNKQVEILNGAGQVAERGRFLRWADAAGMRAMRAGGKRADTAGHRTFKRAGAAPQGQYLIYR
jgi:hypothetical protein